MAPSPPDAPVVLANLRSLKAFYEELKVESLSLQDRQLIVQQARLLIEQVYVHLSQKRSLYAVNPVERLKLLEQRLAMLTERPMTERQFHDELIAIFSRLRDLHTGYGLPKPYAGQVAFLPFLIEEYFDKGDPRRDNPLYLVSKIYRGYQFPEPDFKPGVDVIEWNGIPIHQAIERNADREAGSNEEARRARGCDAMTIRALGWTFLPDEATVIVGYQPEGGGALREIRLDWQVFVPPPSPTGIESIRLDLKAPSPGTDPKGRDYPPSKERPDGAKKPSKDRASDSLDDELDLPDEKEDQGGSNPARNPSRPDRTFVAVGLGIDTKSEIVRRVKKILFAPANYKMERTAGGLPDVFTAFSVRLKSRTFGYVRIWTFNVAPNEFIREFLRIVQDLKAPDGLILDVRGNGGGHIMAGELLLQLLSPKRIEPEHLHFSSSALTLQLSRSCRLPELEPWAESIEQAIAIGENFSQGLSLDSIEWYNRIGQRYHGPVALIVNALCYSTTDIFAAGFEDHDIGLLLGTSSTTGAGGANVWTHELLREVLDGSGSPFQPLPNEATFRVAVRRCTRVGAKLGYPVEDLGVRPDHVYAMQRADVLPSAPYNNKNLIKWAAERLVEQLAERPLYVLSATVGPLKPDSVQVTVTETKNIDRLDVYLDGRPWKTLDILADRPPDPVVLPSPSRLPFWVDLRGYKKVKDQDGERFELVAASKRRVGPKLDRTASRKADRRRGHAPDSR